MNPEYLGTLATLLILASFCFTKNKHIRFVNILGSALFVVYGIMIGAFSVWLLNGACILVNIVKMNNARKANKTSLK